MNKIKIKGYIGIFLIILMFLGFFTWEVYLKKNLMYESVLTLKVGKLKGDTIVAEDLHYIDMEVGTINNILKDQNVIIGAVALVDIPENIPLSHTYFQNSELALSENEFIFEVPKAWIFAMPQSLRSKDQVFFYEIKPDQKVDNTVIIDNNIGAIEESGEFEFVLSTVTKYVKDGSNKEVINVGETRENASSNISSIEIVIKLEDLNKLEAKAKSGSKFIILYNEG